MVDGVERGMDVPPFGAPASLFEKVKLLSTVGVCPYG